MNIWENAVITQKGLALQSKLIAGNTLAITKVQIGAGAVSASLLYKQTAVQDVKKTLTQVTSVTYPEQGKCTIKINITNDDVTAGYTAMQLGFFANDPDEGEILYFIAQAESGTGTIVPSETEMPGYSAEWTFYFKYGLADNVTVTVDPSGTVSQDYVDSNFVKKTGDTMTGSLIIDGNTSWLAASVRRTIGEDQYSANLGVGGTGAGAIEVNKGSGSGIRVGRIDIDAKGIQFDLANKYAMQNYQTTIASGTTILAFANSCAVTSSAMCLTSAMPTDAPVTVDAHILVLVGSGNRKTVFFVPFNNSTASTYTRDISNSAWVNEWRATGGLTSNITLYVATTGNDTTGDGTSTKPFLTIAKALSTVPKNLNGQTVTINVAAGTYSEARVDVTSFFNGEITITGPSSTSKPTISNGVYANKCSAAVLLKWLNLTSSSSGSQGAAFVNCQQATIDTCAVTSATTQQNHGILVDSLSTAYVVGTHVTNCNYAVLSRAARVVIYSISGGGNRIGFYATNGGDMRIRESTVTSTGVSYFTEYGGRIYSAAQASAPSY